MSFTDPAKACLIANRSHRSSEGHWSC